MSARALLAGLALGLVAAAIYFLPKTPEPAPAPAVASPSPGPEDAAAPPPVVNPPDASLPLDLDALAGGFCGPGSGSVRLRFSLGGLADRAYAAALAADAGPPDEMLRLLDENAPAELLLPKAKQAAQERPDSPWPALAWAISAHQLDDRDEYLAGLRRAHRLLPDDPAVGIALADATRDSPDLDEAIDGLAAYLAAAPTPELARLRARLVVQRDIQRDYLREERDGLTLLWPRDELTAHQADELLAQIGRNLDDAAALTGTRRRERLTVVLYPSRSELLAVSCAQSWTAALFDGTLRLVKASTPEGVEVAMVRHESLHAQLSPLAPSAPKWFNEGLAQVFSREKEPLRFWKLMVKNRSWVPFRSLDDSFQELQTSADAGLAYAQAYAMVALMQELGGDAAIPSAVAAFRSGADGPTALAKACGKAEVTGEDLLDYLQRRLQGPTTP